MHLQGEHTYDSSQHNDSASLSSALSETFPFALLSLPKPATIYVAVSKALGFGETNLNSLQGFTDWRRLASVSLGRNEGSRP